MSGSVGSIGSVGTSGGAGALNFGGLNGALGNIGAGQNGMAGLSTIKMQQLSQLLDGFSSAEILMALMLAAASGKKKHGDGDNALGFLAGLAMAQQLGQGCNCGMGTIDLTAGSAEGGGGCNVLA